MLITLDLYHDLDTWWEIAFHQTKSNYDVIIDHAHTFLDVKKKIAVGKIPKRRAAPPCARVSTFATVKSKNSSN